MKTRNDLRRSVFLALALLVLSFGCASQTVKFQTLPDKADLYINNTPRGKTPVTAELVTDSFMNLHPAHKQYTIVAKKNGYEDKKLLLESPSFCYNNTKPFPQTVVLKLRRSWPDGYNAELREFEPVARKYRELFLKPDLPEDARKFKAQAEFAVEQKRYADASNLFEEGIRLCPWWPEGHFNRALVLVTSELSDYKEAVMEMKKYLMLLPNAPDARAAQDKIYQWEGMIK
jgi:tetratricopeptide (TPR) repeat protein